MGYADISARYGTGTKEKKKNSKIARPLKWPAAAAKLIVESLPEVDSAGGTEL